MDIHSDRFKNSKKDEIKKSAPRGLHSEGPALQTLFRGWFSNRMMVILIVIQHVKAINSKTMTGIELFLHDLEHHFIDVHASAYVREAFRYLEHYFKIYPGVDIASCEKAVEMIGRIHEALGMELSLQSHYSVQLSLAEKARRERQNGISKISKMIEVQVV